MYQISNQQPTQYHTTVSWSASPAFHRTLEPCNVRIVRALSNLMWVPQHTALHTAFSPFLFSILRAKCVSGGEKGDFIPIRFPLKSYTWGTSIAKQRSLNSQKTFNSALILSSPSNRIEVIFSFFSFLKYSCDLKLFPNNFWTNIKLKVKRDCWNAEALGFQEEILDPATQTIKDNN